MIKDDITVFQLRSARLGLRLTFKEVNEKIGISLKTLQRLEAQELSSKPNIRYANLRKLVKFYELAGIEFIGNNSIRFNEQKYIFFKHNLENIWV